MDEFLDAISQNWGSAWLCVGVIVFISSLLFSQRIYKLKRMFENDAKYEEHNDQGIIKKGYRRNVWDLSLFPAISKLFFEKDWKIFVACFLLIIFLALYLLTKEQWLVDLVKVNFGLIIGALVGKV